MLNDGGLFLLHYISDPSEKNQVHGFVNISSQVDACHPFVKWLALPYDYGMNVIDVESLRLHYYKTLMHWYNNFKAYEIK